MDEGSGNGLEGRAVILLKTTTSAPYEAQSGQGRGGLPDSIHRRQIITQFPIQRVGCGVSEGISLVCTLSGFQVGGLASSRSTIRTRQRDKTGMGTYEWASPIRNAPRIYTDFDQLRITLTC